MFPILFAAKALAKMSSFGGGSKPARFTQSDTESEQTAEKVIDKQGKEHDADSPTGKMIINMTREQEAPEMFGGMDLNKIKSALDEDSPIGMPEEVKGGVYKQIFEVNKMMLGSLQRIEGTLKLMLNLEYERALAFQQADVQQDLIEGDTDPVPDDPEAGPGRFRRGLSSARGMLGGAYGKLKGSSIIKLLGLGALIFAFNKYRDEIITAMASILEYFNDVYDVFKSEGIGAAFDKVVDDFKNIFFPKIRDVGISVLEFVWGAIKSTAKEFFLGAQGDKAIRQERKSLTSNRAALGTLGETLDFDEVGARGVTLIGGKFALSKPAQKRLGIESDSAEAKAVDNELNSAISSMRRLTRESEGRIQFKGLPDMTNTGLIDKMFTKGTLSINNILDAVPIIDGIESSFKDLNAFGLYESAGITKEMDEASRDAITENLAKASEITRMLNDPTTDRNHLGTKNDGKINIGTVFRPEFVTDAEARARIGSLKEDNLTLGAFSSSVFDAEESMFGDFKTIGDTKAKEEVRKMSGAFMSMQRQFSQRFLPDGTLARPLTLADQKTINNVNAGTVNNVPMSSGKTSWTAMLYANAGTVYQQSN